MPFKRSLSVLSLAALLALTGCASGDEGAGQDASAGAEAGVPEADISDVPEVVAEVNGDEISRDEFIQSYEGQLQQAAMQQQQQGTGEEIDQDQLKQQVAELMVDGRLLEQAAADAGIEPTDADIDATLEDLAAQNGLGSADEVVAALKEQGMSDEEIRSDAASQFQVNTFVESQADVTEPSDEELRAQYDALVEQLAESGQGEEMPPFEDLRDQLASDAITQQNQAALQKIVEDLRKSADVTINL